MSQNNQFRLFAASLPALLRGPGARGLQRQYLQNVLVILATYQAASFIRLEPELLTTLRGGLFIPPFVLFSGLAGQLADRYDKALVLGASRPRRRHHGRRGFGLAAHNLNSVLAAPS
jgi:hypothetical protein